MNGYFSLDVSWYFYGRQKETPCICLFSAHLLVTLVKWTTEAAILCRLKLGFIKHRGINFWVNSHRMVLWVLALASMFIHGPWSQLEGSKLWYYCRFPGQTGTCCLEATKFGAIWVFAFVHLTTCQELLAFWLLNGEYWKRYTEQSRLSNVNGTDRWLD